jgi:hypothetical protein
MNGLGNWVELPLLCLSVSSPFLKDNIVGTDTFSNSLHWKFRSQVEWLEGIEAEASSAQFTLLGVSFSSIFLVKIRNSPSLGWVVSTNSVFSVNWLSFNILSVLDGNNLTILDIGEVTTLELEHLPPS